ncbi:MAG: N-6 DNA methylase [Cyclobacteriaceae bacterium]|nr:N-6 DNA methylase [Cyclobacteriaceae bacterium]
MNSSARREAYQNVINTLRNLDSGAEVELRSFMGFGALKELLLPIDDKASWTPEDLRMEPLVKEFNEALKERFPDKHENILESLRNSTLSSFYTPSFITEPIVSTIKDNTIGIRSILEPSAGTGNFIIQLKKEFPQAAITAIEKDWLSARFLQQGHPDIETLHCGLEEFPNRKFDLIISNIPFGNVSVFDDAMFREAVAVKIKSTTRIHNYFFIKSLDNLKDEGLLAFITSNGVADSPANKEIREYLMKKSDLVTVLRLPNTAFESAGTLPVTDIIVLRKNAIKKNISPHEREFITSEKIQIPDDKGLSVEVNINGYLKERPDQILGELVAGGQYRGDALDVKAFESWTEKELSQAIRDGLSKALILKSQPLKSVTETKAFTTPASDEAIPSAQLLAPDHPDYAILKPGNLLIHQGKVATIELQGSQRTIVPVDVIKDVERTYLLSGLRNTLNRLVKSEQDNELLEMNRHREELNSQYDLFAFRYGNINSIPNRKLCLFDAEGFKLLALEKQINSHYVKADIFNQQVTNKQTIVSRPESLKDALLMSLNAHNGVNIEYMAALMLKDRDEVIREAMQEELIFQNLEPGKERFVTKDKFLSGNIIKKLTAFERLHQSANERDKYPVLTDSDLERHIERLRQVQPVFLKRELIDINIGERWIPNDIYEAFARDLFKEFTEVRYLESTDTFLVNVKGYSNEESITYSATTHNGKIGGGKIMEYAMADTQPYLQIKISDNPPQYKPDLDGMKNVEMKIREVKEAFEKFINDNPQIAQRIETIYNRDINNSVRRDYDGSHLQLKGLSHFEPRSYQKDAVWMLLQQDGGIVDHKVGAGKTLVIISTAMEMRRLGLAQKPLILCMKANVADVAKDFRKAYPEANILAPDPQKDFTKQNRQRIFASIVANDWDAVIITHDMFMAIPQSNEIKKEILEQELNNLNDDLKAVSENRSLSKRVLKGLESRKQNLSVRLMMTEAAIKRDKYSYDFDKLGFDHIFVDESQEFKNLHFTTRHQQVAGLGDSSGSQRALNLELAIRTIQKKKGGDKGATFSSGTTISNSLVELYLLFKYLRPNTLAELKINSFDAWAKMYARKSATYEFSVTNELKMKERYREFIKVPELARFYAEITHVVNDHNLKIDKPEVNHEVMNMEPTESQQTYTQKLISFTKTKDPAYVDLILNEKEMNAFMLIATNLAKKMSIDMRLINADNYKFEEEGKIGRLCKTVADEYNDSKSYRGTQLIFSDLGTPTGKSFNVYEEVKRVLVERHDLDPAHIQFIHDHDSRTKKEQLFKQVNAGEVRVLIGSTKKLGTGVNVQERVIAMHHLDIPWRPSDFEQRTGRGGRQGNKIAKEYRNNVVRNYVYAVNRTLDAYQFNILSNKQKFINQIKNSSIDQRKIDEGAFDQEGGMNFGEYVALLSGNTDLLEKVRLEKKVADLERTYQVFLKRKSEAEFYTTLTRREKTDKETALSKLEVDNKSLSQHDLEKLPIMINGKAIEDKKEAGQQLLDKVKLASHSKDDAHLASVHDFKLNYHGAQQKVFVTGPSGLVYHYADGKLNDNPALAGRYIIDSVKRIPKVIDNTREAIEAFDKRMATYAQELKAEFKDKHLITDMKTQIEQLTVKLEKAFSGKEELPLTDDQAGRIKSKKRSSVRP